VTDSGDEKEFRLGLVCYGGASLAVYMHGVTKEVNHLVLGSELRHAAVAGSGPSSGAGPGTQHVYERLLARRAEAQGVETRVLVDVIAGTSAGGINGVFLSKALAHNRSQNRLRDLWFENGDVSQLLRGPTFVPWKIRLAWLLPLMPWLSPVRGKAMAEWLYGALEGMDEGGPAAAGVDSLMPGGHLLQLYVTITDFFGYDRQVHIADPPTVHDQRHRHALEFRYRSGSIDDFDRPGNGALAFAARTTSSFPGVFPAVSLEEFKRWIPAADLDSLINSLFRIYTLGDENPASTQFIDGGVLDNKPFGWAIKAIVRRRAYVEVERRLLYLEPDPGDAHLPARPRPQAARAAPRPLRAILAAVSKLPSQEPILDDLLEVGAHNERVHRLQEVIRTSFAPVAGRVEQELGSLDQLPDDPDIQTLSGWGTRLHERAVAEAGLAYATYVRLKIRATVDDYARTVCDICDFPEDSNHALLVREAVRAGAGSQGLFDEVVEPTEAQIAFLRNFDLNYGQRRLLFVVAALRWWYRDLAAGKPEIPTRPQLDEGKQILYDAVEHLRRTMAGEEWPPELCATAGDAFPVEAMKQHLAEHGSDGHAYLAQYGHQLQTLANRVATFNDERLKGFSANLFGDLNEAAKSWPVARRRDLLVRYLGFPLWDVLLYPIQSTANAGEADEMKVVRMSPFEPDVLKKTAHGQKLKGVGMGHFAAFLNRAYRENDYLWGRLDGSAILIGILLGKDHPEYRSWCLQAFDAILNEEAGALTHVSDTVSAIKAEVAAG
jgi:patatin-related protein